MNACAKYILKKTYTLCHNRPNRPNYVQLIGYDGSVLLNSLEVPMRKCTFARGLLLAVGLAIICLSIGVIEKQSTTVFGGFVVAGVSLLFAALLPVKDHKLQS
jgi:hypothetical protein